MSEIGERLKALRLRAELSMEEAAKALGMARASSYQYYESEKGYDRDKLPQHLIAKIRKAFLGLGNPPVTADEIEHVAAGIAPALPPTASDFHGTDLKLVGAHADAVRLLLKQSYGLDFIRVPLFSSSSDKESRALTARKPTRRHHYVPADWLHAITNRTSLALVECAGDAMAPTIVDGALVLIDWSVDRVTTEGPYLLSAGGSATVRRCQIDAASGQIRVATDNPKYLPHGSFPSEELTIVGRVIWVAQEL